MEAESNSGTFDLFSHLRDACADEWRAYTEHAFVRGLADGTLSYAVAEPAPVDHCELM
jgi:hypothetical protein